MLALLAGIAFVAQRLFFPRTVSASPIALRIEKALRSAIQRQIEQQERVLEVPEAREAIGEVRARLVGAAGALPYDIEILPVESPVANALTFPGGLVVVTSGLLKSLTRADELAAVIAHELGHVANRHSMHALRRQLGIALIGAVLTGGRAETVQSIITATLNLRFTREAEDQADRYGLHLLAEAGLDPAAFADALEELKKGAGDQPKFMRYLDVHTDIDSRIQAARAYSASTRTILRPLAIDWDRVKQALPSALEPGQG